MSGVGSEVTEQCSVALHLHVNHSTMVARDFYSGMKERPVHVLTIETPLALFKFIAKTRLYNHAFQNITCLGFLTAGYFMIT